MAGLRISACSSLRISRPRPFCVTALLLFAGPVVAQAPNVPQRQPTAAQEATPSNAPQEMPRGKKLMLKDGTYQIVREYQRNGDRVRYYSEERGEWEELPASMVDWDATAKEEAADKKAMAAVAEKVHKQEEAQNMENVADVDASLQVGDGAFLPPGEGLFLVEGKSVRLVQQVDSKFKRDKFRTVEQVLSPVPIVPGKKNVVIPGTHAALRLESKTPEFYLREAPPDPDRVSPINRSGKPADIGPDLVLLRTKPVHNGRELESFSTLFGEKVSENANEISIQRWEVAPSVYRFTLGEQLLPGEYVLAEVLPDGLNYCVWDFGVDANSGSSEKK